MKTAGAYFSYNYEFKELKNMPGLKEELDQFWLENYGHDPAEMKMGEDGWFAGLVMEDGFQDLVNLRLSETLESHGRKGRSLSHLFWKRMESVCGPGTDPDFRSVLP